MLNVVCAGRLMLDLTDHRKAVTCLAFAPDGSLRLATGSQDGTVKVSFGPHEHHYCCMLSRDPNHLQEVCKFHNSTIIVSPILAIRNKFIEF